MRVIARLALHLERLSSDVSYLDETMKTMAGRGRGDRSGSAQGHPAGGSGNEPDGNGSPVRSIHASSADDNSEATSE